MKSRAAVAWEANKPHSIDTFEIGGPRAGEVLVEVIATGVCHTDAYTLSASILKASLQLFSGIIAQASLDMFNDEDDIEHFLKAIKERKKF